MSCWTKILVLVLYFILLPQNLIAESYGDLRLSEDEIDFDQVALGDSSYERILLRWTGPTALWIDFDDSDLPWDIEFDTDCPTLLTPGITCFLEFEFSPREVRDIYAELALRDRHGDELTTIEIFGQAVPAMGIFQ